MFNSHRLIVRRAFTLIELLVVVAIIALLAAILFPVFGRARENARRSACQSNLKQIGLAFQQYTQDYDEQMPAGIPNGSATNSNYWSSNGYSGFGWAYQLLPYTKGSQIFECPDDTTIPNPWGGWSAAIDAGEQAESYAYNLNFVPSTAGWGNEWSPTGPAVPAMTSPSKTVSLFEVSAVNNWCCGAGDNFADGPANEASPAGYGNYPGNTTGMGNAQYVTGSMGGYPTNETTGRHFSGANYLLADGHVKWFPGSQVSSGPSNASPTAAQFQYQGTYYIAAGTLDTHFAVTFSVR